MNIFKYAKKIFNGLFIWPLISAFLFPKQVARIGPYTAILQFSPTRQFGAGAGISVPVPPSGAATCWNFKKKYIKNKQMCFEPIELGIPLKKKEVYLAVRIASIQALQSDSESARSSYCRRFSRRYVMAKENWPNKFSSSQSQLKNYPHKRKKKSFYKNFFFSMPANYDNCVEKCMCIYDVTWYIKLPFCLWEWAFRSNILPEG